MNLTQTGANAFRIAAEAVGDASVSQRLSDIVLRRSTVSAITGLPSSTLYRKVSLGKFPAPIKIGDSASGWLLSEVEAWIAARVADRNLAQRESRDEPQSDGG